MSNEVLKDAITRACSRVGEHYKMPSICADIEDYLHARVDYDDARLSDIIRDLEHASGLNGSLPCSRSLIYTRDIYNAVRDWLGELDDFLAAYEDASGEPLAVRSIAELVWCAVEFAAHEIATALEYMRDEDETLLLADAVLLIDSAAGVHIPREFAQDFAHLVVNADDLREELDFLARTDPHEANEDDAERYWEDWDKVIDEAVLEIDGERFRLHQDGDLWAVPEAA